MTTLALLWLPILVSSVGVFILSAVINMAPLWHKNDFPRRDDQDAILDALRPFDIAPGEYLLPRATDAATRNAPEFQERLKKQSVMMVTVWKYGAVSMGVTFLSWFLNVLFVSIASAYIAGRALAPGAEYLQVFRFVGTTAFLSYAAALWQISIWHNKPWKSTVKMSFDGLLFALLSAGIFGWLWPM